MEGSKRPIAIFVPWMFASACLYAVAYLDHLRSVQALAFLALFLSLVFFALSYRSLGLEQKFPVKYGARISAWATILAGLVYLVLSRWP
jgi:hypothetical protein